MEIARTRCIALIMFAGALGIAGCDGFPEINAAIGVEVLTPKGAVVRVGDTLPAGSITFPTNVAKNRSECCCRVGAIGAAAGVQNGHVRNVGVLPIGVKIKFDVSDSSGNPAGVALQWVENLEPARSTELDARGIIRACDELGTVRLADVNVRVLQTEPPG